MQELHETAIAGHLGAQKLAHALFQRAWWPKLRQWAASFALQCPICSLVKDSTIKSPGLLQPLPIPRRRFSSYGIDFMANLPETKEGYNTIMTVTEHIIKHTQFIPCQMGDNDLSAVQVAELFFKHVVCKFGVHDEIASDRDCRFVSTFW